MIIRDAEPDDEAPWRRLWAAYNDFYGAAVPEAVSDHTWRRILDPSSPLFARLAADDDAVVGFAVCVLHEGSWTLTPICYLEDLFVRPDRRGGGVGRRLVQDLVDLCAARGWSRLYWHTQSGNPARRLYDSFGPADDFVRYRLLFEDAAR